ncbi:MAG TPA: class I SAM-dependent methyltransferase [Burkholderiaceae bacterium]|nr:class I SAM-dependent methyltransferase [Burkholderiaceae bacterium]
MNQPISRPRGARRPALASARPRAARAAAGPAARPDRTAALEQYRQRAGIYDLELLLFEPLRGIAIERLRLRRGDTVIDVGCGTGLSFEKLRAGVGAQGRIIGIEQSPDMLALARDRVRRNHWRNVTLIGAPVEDAGLTGQADAALFHFTHDILRKPAAVANVVDHLRPGAHVVACGLQWTRRWLLPVNLAVWTAALHSVTTLEGLDRPWSHLAARTGRLGVEPMMMGGVYVASGSLRPRPPAPQAAEISGAP